MSIAEFDQTLAEADRTLSDMVKQYRICGSAYEEVENLALLEQSLIDLPSFALAPLLAVAVRRISRAGSNGGDRA